MAVPVGVAAVLVGAVASPAAAHNRLRSSTPADGATLATAPPEARLTFAERVDSGNSQIAVTDDSGAVVPSPAYRVEGVTVIQPLTLPRAGRYQVGFRVISTDGHPVQGKISFTVNAVPATTAAPAGPSERPSPSGATIHLSKTASPSGSSVAAGGSGWTTPALAAGGVVLLGALTFALVARRRRNGGPADGEPAG